MADGGTQAAPAPALETLGERARRRFHQTSPLEEKFQDVGLSGLTPVEKKTYAHSRLILPVAERTLSLSSKAEREFWKQASKDALPVRRLRRDYSWGTDRSGRDLGSYKLDDFEQRSLKHARLTALDIAHRHFLTRRRLARSSGIDVASAEVADEKKRRVDMAALRRELYGEITGPLANDPEWDDVIPIPQHEPEDALAKIAYPDDYAEGEPAPDQDDAPVR